MCLLRVLEARRCPVTDVGIKGLCVSVDDGEVNAGLGQCKSLHTLDIFGTKVTTKGVEMALENLPDLKVFDCNYQIQVLADMLRGPSHKNLRCLQNLTSLRNDGWSIDRIFCQRGDIELVAATCVSVNKVRIDPNVIVQNAHTNATVLELLKLKKLCEFHINGDWLDVMKSSELTFNGGILPLLKHFPLTSLTIENLNTDTPVNIRAIVENCPKLQTLNISCCKISPHQRSEDEPNPSKRMKTNLVLENLKTLKLRKCFDLTVEDFDLLLASPALEELSLSYIDLPIDDSLRKATNFHQFRHLQRLEFFFVSLVTKAGINLLMNDGCPLKVIKVDYCISLNVTDVEEWKGKAREKNWNFVSLF